MIEFKKAAALCLAVFASALCAAQEEAPAAKEQAPEQVREQAQGQAPEEAPEQKEKFLTLNDAIVLAVENNFDLQKQRYAVAAARGQYHQAAGLLDVQLGTQAEYSMSQNPVDQRDPRYVYSYSFLAPKTNYGVYSDNTLRHQTSGSIFVKKLFSFGLEAKLSYTLKLKSAKENLDAMESALLDAVSQTIINVSNDFWNYYMARRNVELLEDLQKKSEQRTANMQVLIQSGARSRNDLLAMQVNELENRRRLQDARMAFDQKKIKLMESIGVSDFDLVGEPQNPFETIDLTKVQPPEMQDINKELLAFIEENRPDLRTLKLKTESCLLKMKMAKADSLPDAKLNFGIGTTGAAYSNNFGEFLFSPFWNVKGLDLNGAASVSIMLGNRTKKGSYEQAEAEYNSSVSEYNKAKNALALQTQNAAQKLLTYKDEVADADRILELQKNLYDNEQQRFRAGLITVNNLIDQDQKYIMAVSAYCQVFINYMNAILEYKRASGGLVSLDTTSAFLKK